MRGEIKGDEAKVPPPERPTSRQSSKAKGEREGEEGLGCSPIVQAHCQIRKNMKSLGENLGPFSRLSQMRSNRGDRELLKQRAPTQSEEAGKAPQQGSEKGILNRN